MADSAFKGRSFLITGGSGSLGRALIEQLLKAEAPRTITVLSRDEMKHVEMIKKGYKHPSLKFSIADIRFKDRLPELFQDHDYVIHAAALRDLVTCEEKPWEAFQTNVIGSKNVFEAAREAKVEKVLFISSDKAVNSRSVYGSTKLISERLCTQVQTPLTKLASIRFGGLLGMRGGIIQKLLDQRKSGTVTVTDPQMSRFSMPLDLAAMHVLKALQSMEGGEVYIPKSPSVKLMDLVGAIAPNAKLNIIGAQAGEKQHDMLFSEEEAGDILEFKDHYLLRNGSRVHQLKSGFSYQSNTNTWSLTRNEIIGVVTRFFPGSFQSA